MDMRQKLIPMALSLGLNAFSKIAMAEDAVFDSAPDDLVALSGPATYVGYVDARKIVEALALPAIGARADSAPDLLLSQVRTETRPAPSNNEPRKPERIAAGTRQPSHNPAVLTDSLQIAQALALPVNFSERDGLTDSTRSALFSQARLWQARRREEMVEEVLTKLLAMAPNDPDVLGQFALFQLRVSRKEQALKTLDKLRSVQPGHADIARIETMIFLEEGGKDRLSQARALARADKPDEALGILRELYPNGPPTSDLTLEYWLIVSETKNGWDLALQGLKKLAAEFPDNLRYELELAEHILSRRPNDPSALKTIAYFARHPEFRKSARGAWHRAMVRLPVEPESIPLLEDYLKGEEVQDTAAIEHLANIRTAVEERRILLADPYYRAKTDGLAWLGRGNLDKADERLTFALRGRPNDADVLGGLGLLRMRQGRHAEAQGYFLQAQLHDTSKERWAGLIRTARFWGLMRQASDAEDAGDVGYAERLFLQARALDKGEPAVLVALARIYEAQGRNTDAETALQDALRHESGNTNALKKLLALYQRTDQNQALQSLIARLSNSQKKEVASALDAIQASIAKKKAEALLAAEDTDGATVMFERAASYDHEDPWLRYELAKLYAAKGNPGKGISLFDALIARYPSASEARYAYSLFLSKQNHPGAALAMLEEIPAEQRDAKLTRFQHDLWLGMAVKRALSLEKGGQGTGAKALLDQAEPIAQEDLELALDLADARIDIGDKDKAHNSLTNLAGVSAPSVEWSLRYARLLSAVDDERILGPLAEQLNAMPLSDKQAANLMDVNVRMALNHAEKMQESNRLKDAIGALSKMRAAYPQNERLLAAETRYFRAAGMMRAAADNYRKLIALNHGNRDASIGLIETLIWLKEDNEARNLVSVQLDNLRGITPDQMADLTSSLISLQEFDKAKQLYVMGLGLTPDNSRLLSIASDLARREGRIDEAIDLLQKSLASNFNQGDAASVQAVSMLRQVPMAEAMPSPAADVIAAPTIEHAEAPTSELRQPAVPDSPAGAASGVAPPLDDSTQAYGVDHDVAATGSAVEDGSFATVNMKGGVEELPSSTEMTPGEELTDAQIMKVQGDFAEAEKKSGFFQISLAAGSREKALLNEPFSKISKTALQTSPTPEAIDGAEGTRASSQFDPPSVLAQSAVQQVPSPDGSSYPELEIIPRPSAGPAAAGSSSSTYRRLADMLDQTTTWGSTAIDVSTRSGSSGKSQYTAVEVPLELKQGRTANGRWTYHADLVTLDAGRLDVDQSGDVFGSALLCQPQCGSRVIKQNAKGVALNAAFEKGSTRYDVGSSPIGFAVQTLIGGVLHRGDVGPFGYSVDVSRRMLTGSVLSYAGTHDPRTGQSWGGVAATGVRFGLSLDNGGTFGGWSSLGLHRLAGKNVQSNNRMQLMAGGSYRMINEVDRIFQLGVTAMHWRMSENAGEYTFGHGGYYSPSRYNSLSIPVTYGERHARFSYVVRGSMSVSQSKTKDAAYFPTNASLQTQAERISADNGVTPFYEGGTGRGVGKSLAFAWEYQVTPRLYCGGHVQVDRSPDYAPNRFAVYLRYAFDQPSAKPVSFFPEGVRPISQF